MPAPTGSLHTKKLFKGTSINCLGEANSQYPRTYSVGNIKRIHICVLKARALKNALIEPTLKKKVSTSEKKFVFLHCDIVASFF